jgi:hypothetical protein
MLERQWPRDRVIRNNEQRQPEHPNIKNNRSVHCCLSLSEPARL